MLPLVLIVVVKWIRVTDCTIKSLPDNWTDSDLLPAGYSRTVPPQDPPVLVSISVHVLSLLSVNEPEQVQ